MNKSSFDSLLGATLPAKPVSHKVDTAWSSLSWRKTHCAGMTI